MGGMFDFLKSEPVTEASTPEDKRSMVVSEGQKIAEENGWGDKYPMLMAGLESQDPKEQYINGYTAILMRNQAAFVQQCARTYGESTVTGFLGDIAPRIMDVIRVFAPNTIAHIIEKVA